MGRIPYLHSANTQSLTAMTIESGGSVSHFKVNQAIGTGVWQKLGEFDLAPDAMLRIHLSKSFGVVVADAFALVQMEK